MSIRILLIEDDRELGRALRNTLSTEGHSVATDRKSTRLNSSHDQISYAVFCLKKKKNEKEKWIGYRID